MNELKGSLILVCRSSALLLVGTGIVLSLFLGVAAPLTFIMNLFS
jgi:hypothetical protein